MNKRYILLLAVMFMGNGFGQYLTYQELIGMLKVADDAVKVDEYLTKRGFEYSESVNDGEHRYSAYKKIVGNYVYNAGIYKDGNGYVAVTEESADVGRWKYFKNVVNGFGYEQKHTQSKEEGELVIHFQNKDYSINMRRTRPGIHNSYLISLSKLKKD